MFRSASSMYPEAPATPMAKSPSSSPGTSSPGSKSPAEKSAQSLPPAAVAKRAKAGTGGNGNRAAEHAQLELVPEEQPEKMEAEDPSAAAVASTPAAPPSLSAAQAAGASVSVASPAMRELGLTAKEMWKVDLKGKRIVLDEKAWREELARALGRAPAKG